MKFLFTDLDDTLFQSRRKCPDDVPLLPAAYLRDGTAHSFLTPHQQSVLQLFQKEMVIIPVTARNADAYSRVKLCFQHEAIVNFGGVILQADGLPEAAWLDRSRNLAAAEFDLLQQIRQDLIQESAAAGLGIRVRIVEDFEVPFYISAKSDEGLEEEIDHLEHWMRARAKLPGLEQILVHRNGNNLAVLPDWLDKRHAVAHLIERLRDKHGEIVSFGMGDSLSDIGFMANCDYALVPQASQINQFLRSA